MVSLLQPRGGPAATGLVAAPAGLTKWVGRNGRAAFLTDCATPFDFSVMVITDPGIPAVLCLPSHPPPHTSNLDQPAPPPANSRCAAPTTNPAGGRAASIAVFCRQNPA